MDEQWQDALKMLRVLMQFRFKKSFGLLAATAYMAAVVVLIQAIAIQSRVEPRYDTRQQIAASPLNLDDPCNRSNAVEIKFCETGIRVTRTRHRVGQTPSTHASSRAASFDSRATTAGGNHPGAAKVLAEGNPQ